MYILETEQAFDSAHFLSGYEGKCRNLHGHRWRIVARIAAEELSRERQTRDMVIDFGDFKDALKALTEELDHCLIIETGSLRPKNHGSSEGRRFPDCGTSFPPDRGTAFPLFLYAAETIFFPGLQRFRL